METNVNYLPMGKRGAGRLAYNPGEPGKRVKGGTNPNRRPRQRRTPADFPLALAQAQALSYDWEGHRAIGPRNRAVAKLTRDFLKGAR